MTSKVVLIISPRFPPTNAADCHRVRLSVRHYQKFGWRPIVLCSDEPQVKSDDWLLYDDVAASAEIVRVKPWPTPLCRAIGFNLIEFRVFFPMLFRGLKIMRVQRISVVFFSTTAFMIFLLGPIWKCFRKLGLVYDIQDPWYQGPQLSYTRNNAPGSWRKYRFMQLFARVCEPIVIRQADQLISVSAGYIDEFVKRYKIAVDRCTLLPFPGAAEDFDLAVKVRQQIFDPADGKIHWVYAGRGAPDMTDSIRSFFRGLKLLLEDQQSLKDKLVIHFVGTNYAPTERSFKVIEPIAVEEKVQDYVVEHPQRVAYLEVLDLYKSADAVLLFGSHLAEYTASKVVNCILAKRPLFVLFHEESLVWKTLARATAVYGCSFNANADTAVERVALELKKMCECRVEAGYSELGPWLAIDNARIQCQVLDKALRHDP